ncbi:MAG: histidine phosphatase family protein [Chloroflexota bacterium]
MTTTILLIRHGETESNAQDIQGYFMGWANEGLNANGFAQAESLALKLAKVQLSAIYCSSSRRAMSTAELIGKYHGLKPVPTPELREINYGEWEGRKRSEIRDKYPEIYRRLRSDPIDVAIPGGESFKQVAERVISIFNSIAAEGDGKTVALVSHGNPIKILIVHALSMPYNMWGIFDIGNASISTLQVTDGIPRIVMLNDRTHLKG